jgi:uncharacterized membrane protein YedE/YeeE
MSSVATVLWAIGTGVVSAIVGALLTSYVHVTAIPQGDERLYLVGTLAGGGLMVVVLNVLLDVGNWLNVLRITPAVYVAVSGLGLFLFGIGPVTSTYAAGRRAYLLAREDEDWTEIYPLPRAATPRGRL